METIIVTFRGKRAECTYQLTSTGLNISWIGSATNFKDTLTTVERNTLFCIILNQNN